MKFPPTTVQSIVDSPLGRIIVAANAEQLAGVWFAGQRHQPDTSAWPVAADHPVLELAQSQLSEYFAGQRQSFDLPLDLGSGTIFQQKVWCALLKIAFGSTCSYADLSAAMGAPMAVRAVSSAIGRNPFSIIVPCHRVLGKTGALTGYAGGIERKAALLQLEGAI